MRTEAQRAYDRERWKRRIADPEFREREKERSKKRVAEWMSDPKNRLHRNEARREWYQRTIEARREYARNYQRKRRASKSGEEI